MMKLWNALGLSTKILCTVIVIVIAVVAVNYVVFLRGYREDTLDAFKNQAAAFTAVADEAKVHASKLLSTGAVDAKTLVAEAQADMATGKSYRDTRFFQAIPVVVGWTTAREAAKKEGMDFKVISFNARNKENEPEAGSFREQMLRDLEALNKQGTYSLARVDPGAHALRYMRSIKLDQTCMTCHGDPAQYGKKDENGKVTGKDPLGFAMEGWAVGDTHGAYEIILPLKRLDDQVAGFLQTGLMWSVPVLVGACVLFVLVLRQVLAKPCHRVIAMMRDVAEGEGDLTKRMNMNRADEVGQLCHWFDKFMDNMQNIIKQVAGATGDVAAAATEIAASSEQMSASVSEVARQCAKAADSADQSGKIATQGGQVVQETVEGMQGINQAVSESAASVQALGQRGEQIGAVIAVINDIADQTNLLALNAAIEAARAGEHGRGFAVVADEVRKLAERTTKATEEISGSITSIQSETTNAVQRMNRGTEQVKAGVERASIAGESLDKIVHQAKEVAGMIQSISAAAEEAGAGSTQSAAAAGQLSSKAEQLRELVGRFRVSDEARRAPAAAARH